MEKAYLVTIKTDLEAVLNNNKITRVYVWDGECDFNFIAFLKKDFFRVKILESGKNITFVTPCTFTESNIQEFKWYLEKNINFFRENTPEFIVNDWGTLFLLRSLKIDANLIIGPYMYYQKRDSLSHSIIKKEDFNPKDIENLGNISIDNTVYTQYFEKFNFKGLELYNYTILDKISHIEYPIHLSYPKVVKSITKYCYNNMIYNNSDILKVVDECTWCEWKQWSFDFNNSGIMSTYTGNKYYYNTYSKKFFNHPDLKISRVVYNYDL